MILYSSDSSVAYSTSMMPARNTKFNGVKIKLPNSTCLLFQNGAVAIVGAKSLLEVAKIPNYLLCLFPNTSLIEQENDELLRICNIVASANFGSRVNRTNLYESEKHHSLITFTPETFPGMKITLGKSLVAIVFYSGKIIITGAKSLDEIQFVENEMMTKIRQSLTSTTREIKE